MRQWLVFSRFQPEADVSDPRAPRYVLVVGAARSGTTWVAEVLARTGDTDYVHEPDSVDWVPYAARARAGMGLLPAVDPGEAAPRRYTRLWDAAFSTHRRSIRNRLAIPLFQSVARPQCTSAHSPRGRPPTRVRLATLLAAPRSAGTRAHHHVVKSVQVPLALEWLVRRVAPSAVVVVRRHPLDIVASRLQFGHMFLPGSPPPLDERAVEARLRRWQAPPRPEGGDPFDDLVWLVGLTVSAYDEVTAAHPEFHVVDHERICEAPKARYRDLVDELGLRWTDQCDEYLVASNAEGSGFQTTRVAAVQAGAWRRRLPEVQAVRASQLLARFPLVRRYPDLLS